MVILSMNTKDTILGVFCLDCQIICSYLNFKRFISIFLGYSIIDTILTFAIYRKLACSCINNNVIFSINCSSTVGSNTAVLRKYILAILVDACISIILISSFFTSNRGSKITVVLLRPAVLTLAILTKGHISNLGCSRAGSQTRSNLYLSVKIFICMSLIGQLACQSIEHLVNLGVVVHSNTIVACGKYYTRASSCIFDNGVPCSVMTCFSTIVSMIVEHLSMTTIVIDSKLMSILLQNCSLMLSVSATYYFFYNTSVKIGQITKHLVFPGTIA